MTARERTLWLRALRYMGDVMRQRGLCGKGWPTHLCGLPGGHESTGQPCQWLEEKAA